MTGLKVWVGTETEAGPEEERKEGRNSFLLPGAGRAQVSTD